MKLKSLIRVGFAVLAGSLLLVGLAPGIASAHVSVSESKQPAGAFTVLTFSVGHGCDGSPTKEIRIQIPEGIPEVTPTVNPGWDVSKVMEDLAEPIETEHGAQLTERVAEVVYTAQTPLPSDLRDTFELSLKTPDTPGETLYFPVVQTCVEGETAWVEKPTEQVPESELEAPAPSITLVAAEDGGHRDAATDEGDATEAAVSGDDVTASADETVRSEPDPGADDSDSSNTLAIVALVVGAVGVVLGGASLASRRRSA